MGRLYIQFRDTDGSSVFLSKTSSGTTTGTTTENTVREFRYRPPFLTLSYDFYNHCTKLGLPILDDTVPLEGLILDKCGNYKETEMTSTLTWLTEGIVSHYDRIVGIKFIRWDGSYRNSFSLNLCIGTRILIIHQQSGYLETKALKEWLFQKDWYLMGMGFKEEAEILVSLGICLRGICLSNFWTNQLNSITERNNNYIVNFLKNQLIL